MIVSGNTVCALALLLCLAFRASGEYELRETPNGGSNDNRSPSNEFGSCIEGKCTKRTTGQEITSGMWFGPRLGKRRRSDEKQQINPEIEMLVNALDQQPGLRWTVITIPANEKRQQTQFTPRLGRGSDEELFSYGDATDRNEIEENDHLLPPDIRAAFRTSGILDTVAETRASITQRIAKNIGSIVTKARSSKIASKE